MINATTGSIAQRIDYDDWGTPTYVTGTPDLQPFAFAGGLWDPDTKLLHLGAREYDPEVRRFLTRDPSGFAGGWNLYGYAGNDPVNYVDPDGNVPWLAIGAAAAAGAVQGGFEGFALDVIAQLAFNGANFDCIDWGRAGTAAAWGAGVGAVTGGLAGWAILGRAAKSGSAVPPTKQYHATQSARRFDAEKVDKFSDLMRQNKWDWSREPKIVVDKVGNVVDGHHRVLAAEKAGVRIPKHGVRRLDTVTPRPVHPWPTP